MVASILCLDFDGVITGNGVTRAILERFAAPGWLALEASYQGGELTVEQFHQRAFALVEATSEELTSFVRETARPREGLLELIDWCHWHGWLAAVVSNGLDFAVDAVLDGLKLDRVARHAGRTRFAYRWRVNYYSPRGAEVQDSFQLSYVSAFQAAGDFVVLVGGSATAQSAAMQANAVFAREGLLEQCGAARAEVYPWDSFQDVQAVLDGRS